jgi:hypothetical protein
MKANEEADDDTSGSPIYALRIFREYEGHQALSQEGRWRRFATLLENLEDGVYSRGYKTRLQSDRIWEESSGGWRRRKSWDDSDSR